MSKLPIAAQEAAKKTIFSDFPQVPKLGFVLHNLFTSEIAAKTILTSNLLLEENPYVDISLFYMDKRLPIITPKFAIYSSNEINVYSGTLVATDITSWQASLNSPSLSKYLYLYDVNMAAMAPKDLIKKVNDSNFKIISRTPKHIDYLKKLGYNMENRSFFDISKEMIMGLMNESN